MLLCAGVDLGGKGALSWCQLQLVEPPQGPGSSCPVCAYKQHCDSFQAGHHHNSQVLLSMYYVLIGFQSALVSVCCLKPMKRNITRLGENSKHLKDSFFHNLCVFCTYCIFVCDQLEIEITICQSTHYPRT